MPPMTPPAPRTPGASPAPARAHTRAHTGMVGDDAMAAATGEPRAHWFALLDGQGATGWSHRDIAAWLVVAQGVDAWWAQGITVGYEQERGMRAPGQRADGLFESSASRTVALPVGDAYRLLADDAARERWLDVPVEVTGRTAERSVRWTMPDGSRVVVRVQAVRDDATRVAVQHRRLADAAAVSAAKASWADRLARLGALAAVR
ncbi:hypothetical protein [Cellulomonas aerilata]|nr:hypothetical protein [Cellulomonas aerilata]